MYEKYSGNDVGFVVVYEAANYIGGFSLLMLANEHKKSFPKLPNSVVGTDDLESAWTYVWKDTVNVSTNLNLDKLTTFFTIDAQSMKIVGISASFQENLVQSLINGK
jgi:hypothetical protein